MADLERDDPLFIGVSEEPDEPEEKDQPLTAKMLKEILGQQNDLNERLVRNVVAPRGQPVQEEIAAPELLIDLTGLPDPNMDPMGYTREYTKRLGESAKAALGKTVQQAGNLARETASQQSAVDRAMALIRDAAPELPEELITVASAAVAKQMQANGLDPRTEIREHTQQVAQDVLDYADDLVSRASGVSSTSRNRGVERTGGMLSPRARRQAPPKQEEKPGDMFAEMKELQKRARIY